MAGSYGNSMVAAGEMRGMTSRAFTKPEMDYFDPRFEIEVWGRAVKTIATSNLGSSEVPWQRMLRHTETFSQPFHFSTA